MSEWWSPSAPKSSGRRAAADRRPLRFWQPFNDWWRSQYELTGKRPTADDIARWYTSDADVAWGLEKPSLHETRTHAKCLRSVESVRDYFRDYRAKKKQDHFEPDVGNQDSDILKALSPPDNASQQTASHSMDGSTPGSGSRLSSGVQPYAPGSDSGGRGSGRAKRGRRGGKAARGRGGHGAQHVPYQNMSSYQWDPATGNGVTSAPYSTEQQLGDVHPGALGTDIYSYQLPYQQYPQYPQAQEQPHPGALGLQQPYMQIQPQQQSQSGALGIQQPYMLSVQPAATARAASQLSGQQQQSHVQTQQPVATSAPAAAPSMSQLSVQQPQPSMQVQQPLALASAVPATSQVSGQILQSHPQVQQAAASALAVSQASGQQPQSYGQVQQDAATRPPSVGQPSTQQQPAYMQAQQREALVSAAHYQADQQQQQPQPTAFMQAVAATGPAPAAGSAATATPGAPSTVQTGQQQQRQTSQGLAPKPSGLQAPKTEPSVSAAPAPGPTSNAAQPPRLTSTTLQLPRGNSLGLPSLFSPTLGSFDMGRMSSLGFDKMFSLDVGGLPPWLPEQGVLDAHTPGGLQPGMLQAAEKTRAGDTGPSPRAGGQSAPQQQTAARADAVPQMPAPQVKVEPVKLQHDMPLTNQLAAPGQHQQQQYQAQPMQQLNADYALQQQRGCMLPPPALGTQYMWQQQQIAQQHMQQMQQQQVQRQIAAQHMQRQQAQQVGVASNMALSLQQQQPYMQQYAGVAPMVGAFNQGYSGNPSNGCNNVVSAPPGSNIGQFGHPAGHAAAMLPPSNTATAGASTFRAAAPPPIAVPSAGPAVTLQRPRRSLQNIGLAPGPGAAGQQQQQGQHAGHNAAGILSELEAIKGPAMQGLLDAHTANQQQRISVSALLDPGPFTLAGRRLSQALDPLTTPQQRLSIFALGSDALDILGLESLDLDAFLGAANATGAADNGANDMVAPVAPGSRTTVRVQGDPSQWHTSAALAAAAFNSLASPTLPRAQHTSALPPTSGRQPQPQPQQLDQGTAVTQGMFSPPVRTSSTGETGGAGAAAAGGPGAAAAGRLNSAASGTAGVAPPGLKRKRGSGGDARQGLVLDLGANVKRQRVSGLLMELDTPRVRALAGPLLSPKGTSNNQPSTEAVAAALAAAAGCKLGAGEAATSSDGKPLSARHKMVLDLRSPSSQQRSPIQPKEGPAGGDTAADPAQGGQTVQAPNTMQSAFAVEQAPVAAKGPGAPVRVLNLADDSHMAAAPAAPAGAAPVPSQGLLNSGGSGRSGSLSAAVSGDGAVVQVTVGKAGSKGFLPAMHEIERMI